LRHLVRTQLARMTFATKMQSEKMRVALTSVVAAVFLTSIKVLVGWSTGSLGILSEAMHSALDLGAALMTYVAVRFSDKPPDDDHAYGHGKIENISAFMQTGILVLTCFFIIKAAVTRLVVGETQIEITVWSFGVLIFSIMVDYTRSRALLRVAKKYRSQALEADALHFSTDIWSSLVVVFGLAFAFFGFQEGDSMAAIGVACFVLWVSAKLLKQTIGALTDTFPKDIAVKIEKLIGETDGVQSFRHLRIRQSGSKIFIDMYVMIKRTVPFELAHNVATEVENRIFEIVPNADAVIHMEPFESEDESIIDKIRMVVVEEGLACHNVRAQKVDGRYYVDFHLECDPYPRFSEAHEVASLIEKKLMRKIPQIKNVKTHIEDARDKELDAQNVTEVRPDLISGVRAIASTHPEIRECNDLIVLQHQSQIKILMNCVIDPQLSLDDVHSIMTAFEFDIYKHLPEVKSVVIHPEITTH